MNFKFDGRQRRFWLHILFGGLAGMLEMFVSQVGGLSLPPGYSALIVIAATSAASFFRKEEQDNDSPPVV